ncbi:TRAP transporter substrate-binding protein DctP [Marinobacterium rhizophilum]|uniref:TRAP transporter substrate-binding protein DctP n=1 Tax=Marinobacterium rhizophilum TaxID=420402 RepID=A0ABY5HLA3_9GAMM|nr:TRAP transporter substrate-binding protein DctP [Marinobacterium rhizophilum]UTW12005.1 TRAP transporter substrate-binding protein DctP [Marinobacterium rhizophilum]
MKKFGATAGAIVLALSAVTTADAQTRLVVQGSANAGDFVQTFYESWAGKFNAMTGDKGPKLEVLPFQAIVPYRETIDATAAGLIAGDMSSISYFSGRDPAFAILGDLVAAYDTPEQATMFCLNGGGKEVLQKVYDKLNPGKLHVVGCGTFTKEALVASKPIYGLADLKGVKMRAPEGLAADLFARVGASPVSLPYSEVFTSIETGLIEAADASSYASNKSAGLHKVATYPLYPGIHSMAMNQLVISKDQWDKLTPGEQTTLEVWYAAMITSLGRASDLEDRLEVAEDKAAGKLTIIDWPQKDRDAFRVAAKDVWEEAAKKSDLAAEALEAHLTFMKNIGLAN